MRLTLLFIFFANHLFALINQPMQTKVTSVNEKEIITATLKGAQVGMYGALVHRFDSTHSTALSWVEVTKIEADSMTLQARPILALEQSALPTGTWSAKAGDEVVLGYNYQRGLLIAPNSSIYKKVTGYHKDRKWVHPDIFATALSNNGHPSPLREDFSQICRTNNIGVISFMFNKSIITVDCQSFKILQNKSTSVKTGEPRLPFYTRVNNIEANWFGDGSDEIEDYNTYYVALIAQHNPENDWIQTYKRAREAEALLNEKSWFESWFGNIEVTTDNDYED